MSDYEPFMIFELDDSGEKERIFIPEEELQANLHPEQVLVIVHEEVRRIFIWKGPKSPVRKRFISSRVAQAIQEELMNHAKFHRCKIVSVDAGDEPLEFLNVFRLESMEVTEKLEDMRYVRNAEKERMGGGGAVITDVKKPSTSQKEVKYYSPALQDTSSKKVVSSYPTSAPATKTRGPIPKSSSSASYPSKGVSESRKKEIMEKILKNDAPPDCKRLNLIVGHTLYAAVSKTANIFGEDVVETDWEPVKKVPKDMIELNNHVLRVYFGEDNSSVEAIEVLENQRDSKPASVKKTSAAKKTAPKKKPVPRKKSAPKRKPAPKKKPGMKPMPEKPKTMSVKGNPVNSKSTGRRTLPKIPNNED